MLHRDSLCSDSSFGMEGGFNDYFHNISKTWCSMLVISALGDCSKRIITNMSHGYSGLHSKTLTKTIHPNSSLFKDRTLSAELCALQCPGVE